jgi:hypothetical protein
MFTIGDWVKHRGTSRIGIISSRRNDDNYFCVKWHWEKGKALGPSSLGWYSEVALVPAPIELTKDDYKAMIDIALDTQDYKWLNILRRKAWLSTYPQKNI